MFKTSFSANFGPLPVPVASYPLSYDIYYPGNVKASSETHEASRCTLSNCCPCCTTAQYNTLRELTALFCIRGLTDAHDYLVSLCERERERKKERPKKPMLMDSWPRMAVASLGDCEFNVMAIHDQESQRPMLFLFLTEASK